MRPSMHVIMFRRFQKTIRLPETNKVNVEIIFIAAMKYKIDRIIIFRPDNFFLIKKMYSTDPKIHTNVEKKVIIDTHGLIWVSEFEAKLSF